jgi:hypothetical protein
LPVENDRLIFDAARGGVHRSDVGGGAADESARESSH